MRSIERRSNERSRYATNSSLTIAQTYPSASSALAKACGNDFVTIVKTGSANSISATLFLPFALIFVIVAL